MGQFEAHGLGAFDDGGGWGGAGDLAGDPVGDFRAQFGRGVDQHGVDDRRAAHVRHFMVANGVKHRGCVDTAQANVDPGALRHGPGETPAVAVK